MQKITSKYFLVLGVLTVVILGSQILMQMTITGSESDSRIINISGRQRMLSQKITKAALELKHADSKRDFEMARKELKEACHLWDQSHHNLQFGTENLSVKEMNNSRELKVLFQKIGPHYRAIKEAADVLIGTKYSDLDTQKRVIDKCLKEITSTENNFLDLMNKITFQYDKQASNKIEKLSTTEYYLLSCTFILILLEIFFIFRPILIDSKQKEKEISKLSLLRMDEKTFSSEQIKQANQRIKDLRELATNLKEELIEKNKEYTFKTTNQMMENLKLKTALEEIDLRQKPKKEMIS